MTPELRMRRPLLRAAALVRPVRSGYRVSPALIWTLIALVIVTGPITVLAGGLFTTDGPLAWLPWLVVPAWILGLPLLYLAVTLAAAVWYGGGAGHPVLTITDGEVRGRIRGLWAGQTGSPDDDDWWDLHVPVADLAGVRVDHRVAGSPALVLELPAPLAERLLTGEATREQAARWVRETGSPAVWPVGMFEGRLSRERRLRALLAATRR